MRRSDAAADFAWSKVRLLPVARLPSRAGSRSRPTRAASSILCSRGMRAMRGSIPSSPPMMTGCKPTPSMRAGAAGWRADEYEFEMLLGVRSDVAEDLARRGERVRLYLPFGRDWWPYAVRRIGEVIRGTQCFFCARSLAPPQQTSPTPIFDKWVQ